MEKPKMILFDYGYTLLYEPDWDIRRGNRELMKYVTKNPCNCSWETMAKGTELIFERHVQAVRAQGYDISVAVGSRVLCELLGVEFSLTPLEMETVFWNAASAGAVMPGAGEMLAYLQQRGIRFAVISDLLWSGQALSARLQRLLPESRFEFALTSGDYFVRKPNRILFEIALRKANLSAGEVWFCGDNPQADVEGAAQAGMFPIWYDNDTERDITVSSDPPQCEHLHIREWGELINVLDRLP